MIIVDSESKIPLFGLDFIGILDRGTNLIEIKPITICNIHCKYCFVHAGDYKNNFLVDTDYIIHWLKIALDLKNCDDIEIHIAPYGEFLLYKDHLLLIRELRKLPQIKIISIQTNGTLLTPQKIMDLEEAGVTRLNISFNSTDQNLAEYLSDSPIYNVQKMHEIFECVLKSKMDLIIAPIWFFGVNDQEIIRIIELAKKYENMGFQGEKFRLGIQNYLVYQTGRKLKKVKERDFSFFYKKLSNLEKEFQIKLKLGPHDFNIHPCNPITPPVEIGDKIKVQIINQGRTYKEFIGALDPMWAVKVISSVQLDIGAVVNAEIIKKKTKENLITARLI